MSAVAGFVLFAAGVLAAVPAQAAPTAHITGTVTASGVGGLEGVTVSAYQGSGGSFSEVKNTTTLGDGSFDLAGLEAGSYVLGFFDGSPEGRAAEYWDNATSITQATPIPVGEGETVTDKGAVLAPGRHIVGTVRGAGNTPLAGIEVAAYPSESVGGEQVVVEFDETNAQGQYDISRLPAGSYRLGFRDPSGVYLTEYWSDRSTLAGADLINVTGGDATGRDAVLGKPAPPVVTPVANTARPQVSGKFRVGKKVKVTAGKWSPGAVQVSYQWLVNRKPVRGATTAKLKLKGKWLGKKVSVRVTAVAAGHSATSVTTRPVKVKPRLS